MYEDETYVDGTASTGDTKKKKKSTSGGDKKAVVALVFIVAAIIVFVVLTIIQKNLINSGEKVNVVVAIKEVPAGLVLTKDNMPSYFTVELRNKADVPEGSYASGAAFVGKVVCRKIYAKEMINPGCVMEKDLYDGIEDPVEISIEAAKLTNAVAGTLRAGDIIDIKVVVDMSYLAQQEEENLFEGATYIGLDNVENIWEAGTGVNPSTTSDPFVYHDTGDDFTQRDLMAQSIFDLNTYAFSATGKYASIPVGENIQVVNVYNSAGLDTDHAETMDPTVPQVATVFTVVVPRYMEDVIWLAMEEGTIQISRVVDKSAQEDAPSEEVAPSETAAPADTQ